MRIQSTRELAVTEILSQIKADDQFSDFISIGPISKVNCPNCDELLSVIGAQIGNPDVGHVAL